uniref:Inhibin subunit beta C n=1 Tax=Pelusios castaneus TaxID=367368 RepID=A0A8C8RHG8_9SAUR
MDTVQILLLLTLLGAAKPSGGGCPACQMAALDPEVQKTFLVERAKQNILSKLHLKDRPNVTPPVTSTELLTALQRLRVTPTNVSERPSTHENPTQSPETEEQEYELLSFAEPGPSTPNRTRLHFHFAQDTGRSVRILHANMYMFWAAPGSCPRRVTVKLLLSKPGGANLTLVGRKRMEVRQEGWATVEVRAAVQSSFCKGGQRLTAELELEGSQEPARLLSHRDSHQPFLVAKARIRARHHIHRRAIECNSKSKTCCRKPFFIDFKEIGWEDWIIQPEGYGMNYCTGPCPPHVASVPGLASSFHTAVLNLIKANSEQATFSSCCVPTRRRPLSLLYYNQDSNIVKTDIPDMIVDACGCT